MLNIDFEGFGTRDYSELLFEGAKITPLPGSLSTTVRTFASGGEDRTTYVLGNGNQFDRALSVEFDPPVSGLTFNIVVDETVGTAGFASVFAGEVQLAANVPLIGDGDNDTKNLQTQLRGFSGVTRIDLKSNDPAGIGFDDFRTAPPETIVVLTHGYQPFTSVTAHGSSRLPQVKAALDERLMGDDLSGAVEIVEFGWREAYVSVPTPGNYAAARDATDAAGDRLAARITTLIQTYQEGVEEPYQPRFHFIGHSLGTLVNAEAVEALTGRATKRELGYQIKVDQVTILDSPLDPAGDRGSVFRHEDYFLDVLDTRHVRYVENFYATESALKPWPPFFNTFTPAFGQDIEGTGPKPKNDIDGGLAFKRTDHITLLDEYADLVRGDRSDPRGNDWNSPVLESWSIPVPWTGVTGLSLTGTNGSDRLVGRGRDDRLVGAGGNDTLFGKGRDDILVGGGGNDIMNGNSGDDSLDGGRGRDFLLGRDGDDVIVGGAGDDNIHGGAGSDIIVGDAGSDTLRGGTGADVFVLRLGEAGTDRIADFAAADQIALAGGLTTSQVSLRMRGDDLLVRADGEAEPLARLLGAAELGTAAIDVLEL